jgi:hypothetical protein
MSSRATSTSNQSVSELHGEVNFIQTSLKLFARQQKLNVVCAFSLETDGLTPPQLISTLLPADPRIFNLKTT